MGPLADQENIKSSEPDCSLQGSPRQTMLTC